MELFVIAIGGTGMRCLESFIHMCAIGMYDNRTINILTLDTDKTNGNLQRVEELIDFYQKIKSEKENVVDGGSPNVDTFFSAKLNFYKFCTDYSGQARSSYSALTHLAQGKEETQQNSDLSSLFLDPDTVQKFDLQYGYRAQTHLGSLRMYQSIIEAACHAAQNGDAASELEKSLKAFVERLQQNQEQARVFVFGSVFGGTGASSIPVIPKALQEVAHICLNGQTINFSKAKFGSTLLTYYFQFGKADDNQMKGDLVVADSNNFALNSQVALQFYQSDPTVKNTYKRFYHVGWPSSKRLDVSNGKGKTIVGGDKQRNNCHVAELLCASAAYDFFTLGDDDLNNEFVDCLYRSAKCDDGIFSFTGSDFVSQGAVFESKLGAFLSLAHIVLSRCNAAWSQKEEDGIRSLLRGCKDRNKEEYYAAFTSNQARNIDEYMKRFAYEFKGSDIVKGWIYQIYDSLKPGKFIFSSDAFTSQRAMMDKFSAGRLFDDPRHNWSEMKAVLGVFSSKKDNSYDILLNTIATNESAKPDKERQKAKTLKEQFIAHVYNAIMLSQKFNNQK